MAKAKNNKYDMYMLSVKSVLVSSLIVGVLATFVISLIYLG